MDARFRFVVYCGIGCFRRALEPVSISRRVGPTSRSPTDDIPFAATEEAEFRIFLLGPYLYKGPEVWDA